jgi:hypothetical protein
VQFYPIGLSEYAKETVAPAGMPGRGL